MTASTLTVVLKGPVFRSGFVVTSSSKVARPVVAALELQAHHSVCGTDTGEGPENMDPATNLAGQGRGVLRWLVTEIEEKLVQGHPALDDGAQEPTGTRGVLSGRFQDRVQGDRDGSRGTAHVIERAAGEVQFERHLSRLPGCEGYGRRLHPYAPTTGSRNLADLDRVGVVVADGQGTPMRFPFPDLSQVQGRGRDAQTRCGLPGCQFLGGGDARTAGPRPCRGKAPLNTKPPRGRRPTGDGLWTPCL